jgi:hypothetical protein
MFKHDPESIEDVVKLCAIDDEAKNTLRTIFIENINGEWPSKYEMCERFSVLYLDDDTKNPYTTSTSPDTLIFLITIIDYLSLDEIITGFLENIIICGVASTLIWADGRQITPFEFVEHDITHGNNYNFACYRRMSQSRDEMLSFYNFCKREATDKDTLYSIKFIMFLLIHEGWCDFFNKKMTKLYMKDIVGSAALPIKRFFNKNDLGLSIPTKFRTSESNIIQFFNIAIMNYLNHVQLWASLPPRYGAAHSRGGKKSKRSKRTKKSKRSKRSKKSKRTKNRIR